VYLLLLYYVQQKKMELCNALSSGIKKNNKKTMTAFNVSVVMWIMTSL